jgi:ABC-2 type transport system permease protein
MTKESMLDDQAEQPLDPLPPLESLTAQARGGVARYLRVYGALMRNAVLREMSFKANFVLLLFVELLWFALQLAFNSVIYRHTGNIGSWTKWEVVLLIGASHFIQQIFQAFFLVNCARLCELVHQGKMDFMLLFPVNTRFLVSLRYVDLGGFVSAASGLCVMVYAGRKLGLEPTWQQIAGFFGLCGAAVMVHYSLMFLMATASFWTVRAQGMVMAYYNLFSIARVPDPVFRGTFRTVFTLAIPMLLVANVPVKVLTSKLSSPAEITLMLAMSAVCFLVSKLVWDRALTQYTSASS